MNRYKIDITPLDLMRVIESKGKYVKGEKIEEDDADEIEVYPGIIVIFLISTSRPSITLSFSDYH